MVLQPIVRNIGDGLFGLVPVTHDQHRRGEVGHPNREHLAVTVSAGMAGCSPSRLRCSFWVGDVEHIGKIEERPRERTNVVAALGEPR